MPKEEFDLRVEASRLRRAAQSHAQWAQCQSIEYAAWIAYSESCLERAMQLERQAEEMTKAPVIN